MPCRHYQCVSDKNLLFMYRIIFTINYESPRQCSMTDDKTTPPKEHTCKEHETSKTEKKNHNTKYKFKHIYSLKQEQYHNCKIHGKNKIGQKPINISEVPTIYRDVDSFGCVF